MNRHERKIQMISTKGEIKEYPSLIQAAEFVRSSPKTIRNYCRSGKQFKGYFFSYIEIDIEDEIWINHPVLPIECSDKGRIKFPSGRITWGGKNGIKATYLRVHIGKKWYLIHRLIAETFIENPMDKPTVDHIDRNRENNQIINLRWATYKEQQENRSDRQ